MKLFLIRHGELILNPKGNYKVDLKDHKLYLIDYGVEEISKTGDFYYLVFLVIFCYNNKVLI